MFTKVSNQPDYAASEHEMLDFWKQKKIFGKLREKNRGGRRWSFLDGPITANNPMGVHHAWGRTYKDVFQRYHAMKGHELRYQNGYDCQGLWVEVEVEKALGFKTKREIEAYGLEKFIEACKARVRQYAEVITNQSIRLGYWMDWDDSYYTMSDENNYTIWSFLKKCHERGFIYKGLDAMPWCPRCGTGISEQERKEGYRLISDVAVFVRFPLKGRANEDLLVWTTTPWTLAANVAAAVNPELNYLKVEQEKTIYYLAESRQEVLKEKGTFKVLGTFPGREMLGWTYEGPFDDLPAQAEARLAHRVIPWKEVLATEGTGIVHIAPGCGKEDFDLSRECSLPVLAPINDEGIYLEGYGFLTGRPALEVAEEVLAHLRREGRYYKKEIYQHDYPHCWRCGTQLLFRAVDEWYINMSWRDEIKEVVDQIRWFPEWGREQELDWLSHMGDWMISKKRYWGLALPIWQCSCGHFEVIGGKEELKSRAIEGWEEFEGRGAPGRSPHRPWIDAVKIACSRCGQSTQRIKDVGNPWLDAGIVPYSTARYNADRDYWKQWMPADLVLECFPGQFRNWFYALLSMSTMMERIPPFKTLFGHALVRDENGREMHKSAGNAIWFDDAAEKMGVDVMRWIYCRQNPTVNLNFGYKVGDQIRRKTFDTWWNVYLFFVNYARLDGFDPQWPAVPYAERQDIDRWLLSKLQALIRTADERYESLDTATIARQAEEFIENLSNWYVRRNRRRFWRPRDTSDRDKLAAYQTLHETLTDLCRVLAPIAPFITERMYRNLVGSWEAAAPESVHLTEFPAVDPAKEDIRLAEEMDVVVEVVSRALGLRETHGLRVRQPLRELVVVTKDAGTRTALERFAGQVKEELNIKKLALKEEADDLIRYVVKPHLALLGKKYGQELGALRQGLVQKPSREVALAVKAGTSVEVAGKGKSWTLLSEEILVETITPEGWAVTESSGRLLALDLTVTPELKKEGYARDVVRHIQQLRKEQDLEISDRIAVSYSTTEAELCEAIEAHRSYVMAETLCDRLTPAAELADATEIELGRLKLKLVVKQSGV